MIKEHETISVELYYTHTCPNCHTFKKIIEDILPNFEGRFRLKKTLASSPTGYLKSLKKRIHSVPTLLINDEIVFRDVPTREELIEKFNQYLNN